MPFNSFCKVQTHAAQYIQLPPIDAHQQFYSYVNPHSSKLGLLTAQMQILGFPAYIYLVVYKYHQLHHTAQIPAVNLLA